MQETKDINGMTTDAIEKAKEMGRSAIDRGSTNAREYASQGLEYASGISEELADFAGRQPWLALAGAFALGYVLAQALRRLS